MARGVAATMNGSRVVVFGAAGQDGSYVTESCVHRGAEVFGFSRRTVPSCDVSSYKETEKIIREIRPNFTFHLAAESTTAHDALFENHAAIASGALNILEAVRLHAPDGRVLLAGSGLQFRNAGRPISERAPFEAGSPYAAARIYAAYLARYYRKRMGIATRVAYLFHHESPARSERHTSKMIAMAAARASLGMDGLISIGNIAVEKEWAFAGDIAEGMVQLILQDSVEECTLGTGEAHSIRDWLEACYGYIGLDWREYVRTSSDFVAEYSKLVSDPSTMFGLGWRPTVSFIDLAKKMVDAARTEIVAASEGICP